MTMYNASLIMAAIFALFTLEQNTSSAFVPTALGIHQARQAQSLPLHTSLSLKQDKADESGDRRSFADFLPSASFMTAWVLSNMEPLENKEGYFSGTTDLAEEDEQPFF